MYTPIYVGKTMASGRTSTRRVQYGTYTPTTCSRWYDHEWLKADYKSDSSIHPIYIGSHANEHEKKSLNFINTKFLKQKKWSGDMVATFWQNLALIRLIVSSKKRFTDGRTDEGCPRHSISSADTVKQS